MRKDFDRVVIERPRYGSDFRNLGTSFRSGVAYENFEELEEVWLDRADTTSIAGFASTAELLGGKVTRGRRKTVRMTKSFDDLLGPIKRFLQSRVGEYWDDVYSEIKTAFGSCGNLKQHALDHILGYVDFNAYTYRPGKVVESNDREISYGFYVDQSGILKVTPARSYSEVWRNRSKAEKAKKTISMIFKPGFEFAFVCLEGDWKKVTFKEPIGNLELHYLKGMRYFGDTFAKVGFEGFNVKDVLIKKICGVGPTELLMIHKIVSGCRTYKQYTGGKLPNGKVLLVLGEKWNWTNRFDMYGTQSDTLTNLFGDFPSCKIAGKK